MRRMTDKEIQETIGKLKWATICTVTSAGQPYAIEATPFYTEKETCFMINPRGGTWKNLQNNKKVLIKYTLSSPDLTKWAGVSCYGQGRFVEDLESMATGWELLGRVMGCDYSLAAEKFIRIQNRSPLFAVCVESRTGRCSARPGQPLCSL